MFNYLRFRYKSYIIILLGIFIGTILADILFDNPDYIIGFTCVLVGLLIGECIMIKKWFKKR
ncbi:hypothetical protein AM232_19365 [Bacillus sp. FJAT-21352]|nr:hypothetical protein AM232_19365 [Bacillus sp. FJAT-21352]